MNKNVGLIKQIYVALRLDKESEEVWLSDRLLTWIDEIEKEFGQDEMDLYFERFKKTNSDHLYVGAKVSVKRDIPYAEFFNDPTGEHKREGDPDKLLAGLHGVIEDTDLEDSLGQWDCNVVFADGNMWACRVEWLTWEDDDDDEDC